MILQIECSALQLESICKALHMFNYSTIDGLDISKEGWTLAIICEDWIAKEKELKEEKKNSSRSICKKCGRTTSFDIFPLKDGICFDCETRVI